MTEQVEKEQRYIGVKTVDAVPMTRYDAEKHLGRDVGGDSYGDGYLVTYELGYQSWSPKDVFDAAYRQLPTGNEAARFELFNIGDMAVLVANKAQKPFIVTRIHELNPIYNDDFKDRVALEKEALDEKLEKLKLFITSESFSDLTLKEQELLQLQAGYMQNYSNVLSERITNF